MSTTPLYQYPLKPASWNERDLLLFAASIGCDEKELQYLFELNPDFSAFPTYPIVLTFKHDYTNTTSFAEHFTKHLTPPKGFVEGFPGLDIRRVVDGERTLDIITPLPKSSNGRRFFIRSQVTNLWDKGPQKPTIVQTTHDLIELLVSSSSPKPLEEVIYARMSETAIFMAQGGWRGPNPGKKPSPPSAPTERKPDATFTHHISATAHLLYRLNGDYNPLHATEVKEAVVQPTPIMHGLYSWNAVARGVLNAFGGGKAKALKSFRASFASPVRPGDVLETEMWVCGEEEGGVWEVRFVTRVGEKVVLANGLARIGGVKGAVQGSKL